MKATMTAINPPHTTNIFNVKKTIEWRTFPMPIGLHLVYETKACFGQGKVIGTFEITRNYKFNSIDEIPDYLIEAGCVPRDFLEAYAAGRKIYANIIIEAKRFKHTKKISEFRNYTTKKFILRPPQSYVYVEV